MLTNSTRQCLAQLLTQQAQWHRALAASITDVADAARSASTSTAAGLCAAPAQSSAPQQQQQLGAHNHHKGCSCNLCTSKALHTAADVLSSDCAVGHRTWASSIASGCSSSSSARVPGESLVLSRGFAVFTGSVSHDACGHGHHHGHDGHECGAANSSTGSVVDQLVSQIQSAQDLQQLQDLIQQHSSHLSASSTAAAFKQTLQLAAGKTAAAGAAEAAPSVLQGLTSIWLQHVQNASISELSDCLFSVSKLGFKDEDLWSRTLAVVPDRCPDGDGRDLANIAFALAAMAERNAGEIPGVSRDDVQDVLRAVTQQVVSMVSGPGGASDHSHDDHDHGDGGCDGHHHKSDKKGVTIGNISTVRWAHEVFESL